MTIEIVVTMDLHSGDADADSVSGGCLSITQYSMAILPFLILPARICSGSEWCSSLPKVNPLSFKKILR